MNTFSHPQIHSRLYRGSMAIQEEDLLPESRPRPPSSSVVARRLILASLGRRRDRPP
jgi:hypothetical protein